MKCPTCGAYTEVIDSRMRSDGTRRRRYLCANMHRFTTAEMLTKSWRGLTDAEVDALPLSAVTKSDAYNDARVIDAELRARNA
jgi:hypothetical protein